MEIKRLLSQISPLKLLLLIRRFVSLWAPLYLGLRTNLKDNGFAEVLYAAEWENFPLDIQRVICLLIHRKQNEAGLKLGPFSGGLNRETFKIVCLLGHNIYQSKNQS